jgi:LacI family transcriptional regulator
MPTDRPTLATVAEAAGVSVATVSKVLNDRSDVAPATRARVQRSLAEHRYTAVPRRRQTTERSVELLVDHLHSTFTTEVIQGVLDAAAEAGVDVILSTRFSDRPHEQEKAPAWARRLARSGRIGVIAVTGDLYPEQEDALAAQSLPVVLVDPLDPQISGAPSIGSTNYTGGLTAGQHLVALGHRRVGYVGGARRSACNAARANGLRAALDQHRLSLDPAIVTAGAEFNFETGLRGGLQVLSVPNRPTAVLCGSDEVALGVVEAARRQGLRVPQDLSVVGFDDSPAARTSSPPLTTVRQPLGEMGALALRTVLRLADGGTVDAPHIELATRLVVRASTATPEPAVDATGVGLAGASGASA